MWGKEGEEYFQSCKYEMVRLAAKCVSLRTFPQAMDQITAIIENRVAHPGKGIPTTKEATNKDWLVLGQIIMDERARQLPMNYSQEVSPYAPPYKATPEF